MFKSKKYVRTITRIPGRIIIFGKVAVYLIIIIINQLRKRYKIVEWEIYCTFITKNSTNILSQLI